jgi:CoA-transferase family III
VIEIRPPGGEITRRIGPFSEGQSAVFAELNRGKRSVIADLRNGNGADRCVSGPPRPPLAVQITAEENAALAIIAARGYHVI